MNIFVVHTDPQVAARMLCDQHVVSQVKETAQMLSTAYHEFEQAAPYRATHRNHPCSVWVRESTGNYTWLVQHGLALGAEYFERYGRHKNKRHASEAVIRGLTLPPLGLPYGPLTPFAQAMPEEYRGDDAVEAYRRFYLNDKRRFARWTKERAAPEWWPVENTVSI